MPSTELCDLALLLHRHQWVRMRTRVQNALHAIAMAHGVRRGHTLWNREGQALLASLPLAPHTAHRRSELQALYRHLDAHVDQLGEQVKQGRLSCAKRSRICEWWAPSCRWRHGYILLICLSFFGPAETWENGALISGHA